MRSMTGYAKLSSENDRFRLILEIKSVNNKNLALKIKLPYNLNFMDNHIRLKVAEYVTRGSVDLRVDLYDKEDNCKKITYDKALANDCMNVLNQMEEDFNEKFQNKLDLLVKNFSVINKDETDLDEGEYKTYILSKLDELLPSFIETKQVEGDRLQEFFQEHLIKIEKNIQEIKFMTTEVIIKYKQKLLDNIKLLEKDVNVSEEDILKEVLIFSDRVDISEELSRLESHLQQLKIELISKEKAIGKKIEFILQEIFRELNTTGVKSNMYEISKLIVDSKNNLEKMREQIMNIE